MTGFGICLTHHGDAMPPHVIAREAEARGIDAFFVPENSHVPVERERTARSFACIHRGYGLLIFFLSERDDVATLKRLDDIAVLARRLRAEERTKTFA